MRLIYRGCLKNLYFLIVSSFTILILLRWSKNNSRQDPSFNRNNRIEKDVEQTTKRLFPDSGLEEGSDFPRVSYEDPEQVAKDAARQGLGENGQRAKLPPELEKKKQTLWDINGFNGLLSEQIALDRALKDIRHSKCASLKYSSELPTASVVIPFFEEHFTTLIRTVTSVVNRSPSKLLKEIILVDDGSKSNKATNKPLEDWLSSNLAEDTWRIVRLESQQGLIAARMAGANIARGDVIVVLDSHCETMINWLVPLLEPILKDYRTVVSPLIDIINNEDFSYFPQDNGGRGGFDWRLFYKRMPLLPEAENNMPHPFENPVMNGGLFAISRQFYTELEGYDPGIRIWGGEQYELSFKIWQCGGRLLDAPCSRVGHVFRGPAPKRPRAKGNYVNVNYKRVGKVWMDEYIEALYLRNSYLKTVDEGDISHQLMLRKKLNCKGFDWFLHEIAPDILKYYPPYEPPDFANGTIRSHALNNLCLDSGGSSHGPIIPYNCHGFNHQVFRLSWRKTIKIPNEQFCFQTPNKVGDKLTLSNCQNIHVPNHQIWHYNPKTKQLREKVRGNCVTLADDGNKITVENCIDNNVAQKWDFSYVDIKLIEQSYPYL